MKCIRFPFNFATSKWFVPFRSGFDNLWFVVTKEEKKLMWKNGKKMKNVVLPSAWTKITIKVPRIPHHLFYDSVYLWIDWCPHLNIFLVSLLTCMHILWLLLLKPNAETRWQKQSFLCFEHRCRMIWIFGSPILVILYAFIFNIQYIYTFDIRQHEKRQRNKGVFLLVIKSVAAIYEHD